ncbi:MAG: resolvase [candidate division Kazan bacterium GW2011_GWB1_52_7]|uniref:Resolvase n=1 Tax=candidate division Kazan bacterium GW2011_GWB1_52_7 TaxID=1620414 RepID=A0A0G2A2V6_UNCK3|nr:MAG: resolvase [candidate division Kazan bacterium GW2011_GWB1_52_7]
MSDRNRKKTLPVSDAARYLGVSPETLRRWDQKGILKPFRTKGGQRRYSLSILKSFQSGERKPPKLSISQAARELGVHPETLRRWERAGELSAERTSGGQRRYTSSQIAKLEAAPQPALPPQEEKTPVSIPQVAHPPTGPGGLPPLSSLPPRMPLTPPPLKEKPKAEPIPIPIRSLEHYQPKIKETAQAVKKVSVLVLALGLALVFWLDALSLLTRERIERLVSPNISSPIVDINDIAGYEIVVDRVSFIKFKFPLDVPGLVTQTLTVLGDAVFGNPNLNSFRRCGLQLRPLLRNRLFRSGEPILYLPNRRCLFPQHLLPAN